MVCYVTVLHCVALYDMVWYDMVWYGMVWYCMIWFTIVLYSIIFPVVSAILFVIEYNFFYILSQGFLVAWVMRFFPKWLRINQGMKADKGVNEVRKIIQALVPDKQERWYKGLARVVFTYLVVSIYYIRREFNFSIPSPTLNRRETTTTK